MIHTGDCIEVMAGMPPDSVDAVVTDPPYGIGFMGKSWDAFDADPVEASWSGKGRNTEAKASEFKQGVGTSGTGFRQTNPRCATCGRAINGRDTPKGFKVCHCETPVFAPTKNRDAARFQQWCEMWAAEAWRVTKPGGYLLAFGGTRTHHRLVCGLEDAGWIIRDELDWIYASGFPKGRANLKPAHEPIVLARKPGPLRPLNIEETRIGYSDAEVDEGPDIEPCEEVPHDPHYDERGTCPGYPVKRRAGKVNFNAKQRQSAESAVYVGGAKPGDEVQMFKPGGRWPSNLLLSDPELFDEPNPWVVGSGATSSDNGMTRQDLIQPNATDGDRVAIGNGPHTAFHYGDSGGYSRFFIIPKADRADREPVLRGQLAAPDRDQNGSPVRNARCSDCGRVKFAAEGARCDCENPTWIPSSTGRENSHATVKPTDLMRHLIRLVTPPGGTVLDPFLGSGSTAIAAELEGFPWIGIEKEPEYVAIAEARLNGTQRGLGLDVGAPTRTQKQPGRPPGRPTTATNGTAPKGWSGRWGSDEEPAA